jgi:glucose/arabinose dehydrogenase
MQLWSCAFAAIFITSVPASAQTFTSSAGPVVVETIVRGVEHPWSLAFLPDGHILVTERPGRMRIASVEGELSPPVANVPAVTTADQSGLLDVVLDRDFRTNKTIYFCYHPDKTGAVHLASARLLLDGVPRLAGLRPIFQQEGPPSHGGLNVNCRIRLSADGTLFLSLGDHGRREEAQNLGSHLGKTVRIKLDGSVPADNPFVGQPNARPEIWTYGHRNVSSLTVDPLDGRMWATEHGPRGGDELNILEKGKNYGWPVITHGIGYDGKPVGIGTHKEGMEQPVRHWSPSIAPSSLTFYSGKLWPSWRGSIFVGGLAASAVIRLPRQGTRIINEERLLQPLGERIRAVREGPDGALWLLTDSPEGRMLRMLPKRIATGPSRTTTR